MQNYFLKAIQREWLLLIIVAIFFSQNLYALPYWDEAKVPHEKDYYATPLALKNTNRLKTYVTNNDAINVLRVHIDWKYDCGNSSNCENYNLSKLIIEPSGTPALLARSKHKPRWGSYLGIIKDKNTDEPIFYDAIGTGKAYREIVRAITLRFPIPEKDVIFELYAENPQSGVMEKVLVKEITLGEMEKIKKITVPRILPDVEIKELSLATEFPSLRVNIYAESYYANEKDKFWKDAAILVEKLKRQQFPGVNHMSFYAVFGPSTKKLGYPYNLGFPIPEYDSFLGLYAAYWYNIKRWDALVYPTREEKFRDRLALAPYDIPIVIVNTSKYFGIANYNALMVIPSDSDVFTYLFLHELGHFFGLNEEYDDGGPTELEFAAAINEPWSQNLTFLRNRSYRMLKWKRFVDIRTQIPTPYDKWQLSPPRYGAYRGGYAESPVSNSHSYTPGLRCVMDRYSHFCDICRQGIFDVLEYFLDSKIVSETQ